MNPLSDNLPEDVDQFLHDMAQELGDISYADVYAYDQVLEVATPSRRRAMIARCRRLIAKIFDAGYGDGAPPELTSEIRAAVKRLGTYVKSFRKK